MMGQRQDGPRGLLLLLLLAWVFVTVLGLWSEVRDMYGPVHPMMMETRG